MQTIGLKVPDEQHLEAVRGVLGQPLLQKKAPKQEKLFEFKKSWLIPVWSFIGAVVAAYFQVQIVATVLILFTAISIVSIPIVAYLKDIVRESKSINDKIAMRGKGDRRLFVTRNLMALGHDHKLAMQYEHRERQLLLAAKSGGFDGIIKTIIGLFSLKVVTDWLAKTPTLELLGNVLPTQQFVIGCVIGVVVVWFAQMSSQAVLRREIEALEDTMASLDQPPKKVIATPVTFAFVPLNPQIKVEFNETTQAKSN
jgi:hypothetical protein